MKRVWHFFWQSIKKHVTLSYFVFIFLDVYNTWIDLITYNFYSANFKLLRLESPSGMCAELRTVAASNNRDHATRSLYYCLFAPHNVGVVLRAHSVRGEPRIQCNASGDVATKSWIISVIYYIVLLLLRSQKLVASN